MGMFDMVWVRCECGGDVDFQSKAADFPALCNYELDAAPLAILADIAGKTEECVDCGRSVTLQVVCDMRLHPEWSPTPSEGNDG